MVVIMMAASLKDRPKMRVGVVPMLRLRGVNAEYRQARRYLRKNRKEGPAEQGHDIVVPGVSPSLWRHRLKAA